MEPLTTGLFGVGAILVALNFFLGVVEVLTLPANRPPKRRSFTSIRLAENQYQTIILPSLGVLGSSLFVSLSASFYYGAFTSEQPSWHREAGAVLLLVGFSVLLLSLGTVFKNLGEPRELARDPFTICAAAEESAANPRRAELDPDTLTLQLEYWEKYIGSHSLNPSMKVSSSRLEQLRQQLLKKCEQQLNKRKERLEKRKQRPNQRARHLKKREDRLKKCEEHFKKLEQYIKKREERLNRRELRLKNCLEQASQAQGCWSITWQSLHVYGNASQRFPVRLGWPLLGLPLLVTGGTLGAIDRIGINFDSPLWPWNGVALIAAIGTLCTLFYCVMRGYRARLWHRIHLKALDDAWKAIDAAKTAHAAVAEEQARLEQVLAGAEIFLKRTEARPNPRTLFRIGKLRVSIDNKPRSSTPT